MEQHNLQPGDIDGVAMIGFRIDPNSEQPDIYTLQTYGAKNILLVVDEQILFFSSRKMAVQAFCLFDPNIQRLSLPPSENDFSFYDVASALHILSQEEADESATVLDFLNVLFDLVVATQIPMPSKYKEILFGLADYLTFDENFEVYINQNHLNREEITNAILWCCGAVVVSSKVVKEILNETEDTET